MDESTEPIRLPTIDAARRLVADLLAQSESDPPVEVARDLAGDRDPEGERDRTAGRGDESLLQTRLQTRLQSRLGNYSIESVLGEGVSGTVFGAIHAPTGRRVAIKLHHRVLCTDRASRRAWRELELLSELRLPCVPHVLDYGELDGRLFIVTEHVQGGRLADHCAERNLSRRDRVELLVKLARAVQLLHERGVIHRDLKSDNVIVNLFGNPVILDLGIAILTDGDPSQTIAHDAAPIGSPAFMAPEQARGDRAAISTRSDVYGLGAISYELLAGQTPHEMPESLHAAIRRVADEPPRDPRSLDPQMPRPLAAILLRAVAPSPDQRYASATDFADDLDRWLRGEPVTAVAPSILQRLWRTAARRPAIASALSSLLVAGAILTATATTVWWSNVQPHSLQIDPINQSFVALVARNGRPLHTWETGRSGGIVAAQLVEDSRESGPRRLALIAFGVHPDDSLDGALVAFDVRRPDQPYWSSGNSAPAIGYPTGRSYGAETPRFNAGRFVVADVFPGRPGLEVVSMHRMRRWSPTAIRVTDLDGNVLYERWHHGDLHAIQWVPSLGAVVATGFHNADSWERLGYPEAPTTWPRTLIAVRPTLQFENSADRFESPPASRSAGSPVGQPVGSAVREGHLHWDDAQVEVLWRRILFPPKSQRVLSGEASLGRPRASADAEQVASVRLGTAADRSASLEWVIDAHGETILQVVSDHYRLAALPDPSAFMWLPIEEVRVSVATDGEDLVDEVDGVRDLDID